MVQQDKDLHKVQQFNASELANNPLKSTALLADLLGQGKLIHICNLTLNEVHKFSMASLEQLGFQEGEELKYHEKIEKKVWRTTLEDFQGFQQCNQKPSNSG